jgi:hypothetical protein
MEMLHSGRKTAVQYIFQLSNGTSSRRCHGCDETMLRVRARSTQSFQIGKVAQFTRPIQDGGSSPSTCATHNSIGKPQNPIMKLQFSRYLVIVGACCLLLPVTDVQGQVTTTGRTSAALSAGLNLGGLDELLETVRVDLLPELVIAMNDFIEDNLSFSRSETAFGVTVAVSAAISQFILQTADDSIGMQVEGTNVATAARVKLNASNMKLGASASATVSVSAPGLGGVSCYLGVDGLATVRTVELSLGVAKASTTSTN